MFTKQQEKDLAAPLNGEHVRQRQGANRQSLSYLEAWQLIADANRIFGFGNWSRETLQMEALHEPKLVTHAEAPEAGTVVAAYFARVRVTVWAKDGTRSIVREGCGAARGFARTIGEAMENAIKAAETDAMKRALVTFGDQFGLTLYDKAQRNVATRGIRARIATGQRTAPRHRVRAAAAAIHFAARDCCGQPPARQADRRPTKMLMATRRPFRCCFVLNNVWLWFFRFISYTAAELDVHDTITRSADFLHSSVARPLVAQSSLLALG